MPLLDKYCNSCKTTKQISAFGKDKYNKDGWTYFCKICRNIKQKEYNLKNPAIRKKINDRCRQRRKEYYNDPIRKMKQRNVFLKKSFNLTHTDYIKILNTQNGVCGICKKHRLSPRTSYMAIDHCHESNYIRGILCNWCNRAIGLLNEDITVLQNAINYLKGQK